MESGLLRDPDLIGIVHHRGRQHQIAVACRRNLSEAVADGTGVMFTPGSAMDMEGHVRIGYANNADVLREGLHRVSGFLAQYAAKRAGQNG